MIFNDSPHDRESEAESFGFRTRDGFGKTGKDFVGNPRTVVLNRQNDVVSVAEGPDGDRRFAGVRRRLHRIAKEIDDHELEFDGPSVHPKGIALGGRRRAAFRKERGIGFTQMRCEMGKIDRFFGGLTFTGVFTDTVHDGACTLGVVCDVTAHRNDFFFGERSLRGAAYKTVGKESYGGERLMDFVGDEAGELSHNARALQRFDSVALRPFSPRRFLKFRFTPPNEYVGPPGMEKK